MCNLAVGAQSGVGLDIRWEKCSVAFIAPHTSHRECRADRRRELQGATLQAGRQYSGELEEGQRKFCVAYKLRRSFRRTKAHAFNQMRMLKICVWFPF